LPSLGSIGFTLVFVLFAIIHCAAWAGWKRMGVFFVLTAVVCYLLEEVGVRTGLIYGPYHYSEMLGPKLGHVPVLIPLAWFMMIYPSWVVARALLRGVETSSPVGLAGQALIAAMVMTAWDTVMDPGMAAAGNWTWEQGGPYFGVPFQNYFGWLLTTFLVYLGAGLLWRGKRPDVANGFAAMPIVVYAFYGLSYVAPRRIPALEVVALFAMVMPALLALMQVCMAKKAPLGQQQEESHRIEV
jgi:putative membrane protein